MASDEFVPDELLFRAVPEIQWVAAENRVSSAAFKDSGGVSVDRQFERPEEDCVKLMLSREKFKNAKAIVKVTVRDCIENNAKPVYSPTEDNEFHSEIHRIDGTITLSQGVANKLSRSPVCHFRED